MLTENEINEMLKDETVMKMFRVVKRLNEDISDYKRKVVLLGRVKDEQVYKIVVYLGIDIVEYANIFEVAMKKLEAEEQAFKDGLCENE